MWVGAFLHFLTAFYIRKLSERETEQVLSLIFLILLFVTNFQRFPRVFLFIFPDFHFFAKSSRFKPLSFVTNLHYLKLVTNFQRLCGKILVRGNRHSHEPDSKSVEYLTIISYIQKMVKSCGL